jgi:Flp pilus assembly protein TadG
MGDRVKRLMREEKGQSLTEFALIFPLLLLMVCGIIDVGRIMHGYLYLQSAVQETVRLGGLGKNDREITAFAQEYVHLGESRQLTVAISPNDSQRKSGEYVTVTLTYTSNYLTPLISNILPTPVVTAQSTIRME